MTLPTHENAPLLLVDDKPENLLSLEAVLGPLNQPMERAASGTEALRKILSTEYAVILLDVNMPGMDGYETARLIKLRPRSRHIPIIFLTAAERASVSEMYRLGAVDFLQKPFSPEVLVAKVSVFIELHLRGERLRAAEIELLRQAQRQSDLEKHKTSELLVGMVSHDLRSPLAAIDASLQLLRRNASDKGALDVLERATRSTKRMERMIGQLLDLTRVRLGHGMSVVRQKTDLVALVNHVVDEVRAASKDRELVVASEKSVEGNWDPDRVEQVVQNLVGNAVRHGAKDAPVTVSVASGEDEAVVSVHNLGEPIPPEVRTSLFDLFHRGPSSNRDGLGLGLFIANQVATAHGGSITVDSTTEGTVFRFHLPRWHDGE